MVAQPGSIKSKMVEVVRRQSSPVVFLLVVLVLLTEACGRDTQPPDTSFSVRVLTARTISGRWERAAERGLGRIAAELDADVARVRIADSADERNALTEQGRAGVSLVFCLGGYSETVLYSVATAFPKTVFVMLPGRARAENVAGIRFRPELSIRMGNSGSCAATASRGSSLSRKAMWLGSKVDGGGPESR